MTSRNSLFDSPLPPPVPPPVSSSSSPRTSSFFDSPNSPSPSPAPRWTPKTTLAPSPLSLSRASSLRRRPLPAPLSLDHTQQSDPLSPLHQSPSLQPEWRPPLPSNSDDIGLRFSPTPTYLLGEGRYAQVYLASYKYAANGAPDGSINSQGDGLVGGSWRLCAAKRMAPDRESQTMGLREAFFLNRLRAPHAQGSVFIVKMIAVKEDVDHRRTHSRSSSEAIRVKPTRQRSTTLYGKEELSSSPSLPALAQAGRSTPSISRLVLLLEHAPLGTMDRLLRTSPTLVGRQMWERWAKQTVEALAWVHGKGVVHADVKPGNLLLTQDLHVRLSDFGSSLLIHPDHPPSDGVGLGTLPFSPPELVNPSLSFSFPIDIFALGATLYQCVTGREPYRGCRSVEIMHHVRKGDLWIWEERARLGLIGTETPLGGSPYPSAWRVESEGIKRGGSLRVPTSSARPGLVRMPSADSLRASHDVTDGGNSPAGVKLWAKWIRQPSPGPIAALLSESESGELPTVELRQDFTDTPPRLARPTVDASYEDGSPLMIFLDGQDGLSDGLREVLKAMLDPDPSIRPTAEELKVLWGELML